jgi:hypothetical protein
LIDDDGEAVRVPPSLPRDVDRIEEIITTYGMRLVVIDVLVAYVAGKVDSHRDQDVRGVLHRLAAMAERTGATVVLIRHLRKAHGGNALYAGGGSIGIVGAARAAYLAARDPEDEERRILATAKSNLGPEAPSLAYRLVGDAQYDAARIAWQGTTGHTAADLLRDLIDDEEHTSRGEAVDWLIAYLRVRAGAPRPGTPSRPPSRSASPSAPSSGLGQRRRSRPARPSSAAPGRGPCRGPSQPKAPRR